MTPCCQMMICTIFLKILIHKYLNEPDTQWPAIIEDPGEFTMSKPNTKLCEDTEIAQTIETKKKSAAAFATADPRQLLESILP